MIVVRVELWSAITGQKSEIARMHITNDGSGSSLNPRKGDYNVEVFKGRSCEALGRGHIHRTARVEGYNRLSLHVWNLVKRALDAAGYR